jgi:hypothetical protein
MWITPEGVPPPPKSWDRDSATGEREAGDLKHDRLSRLPRLSALMQPEASGLRSGLGPPSAPARALSASASRTTSVVHPADPRTLMERREVRLRLTDGSLDYREARRRLRRPGRMPRARARPRRRDRLVARDGPPTVETQLGSVAGEAQTITLVLEGHALIVGVVTPSTVPALIRRRQR